MARAGITRAPWIARTASGAATALALSAVAFGFGLATPQASAQQFLTFPQRPVQPRPAPTRRTSGDAPMLLQATEIQYDYVNKLVSAVGSVQIYYNSASIEADKIVYNQTTKRMLAEGNVRLTEADGKVTTAEIMNLSDDFRDGFVDSLRLNTPDQTRMAATRAERVGGNITVFQGGVYTACEACKEDPKKPPTWQVKSARMIHDEGEKMIYFENASLEFFGRPVAYLPFLSAPDPTVKRKSGFLAPLISSSSKYGAGLEIPYYWALAPNYDVTFSPRLMTGQGALVQGEFRHRLETGAYSVRASGLYQLDKDPFERAPGTNNTPGFRDFRGTIESAGQFALNNKWVWGWDAIAPSDPTYYQDYGLRTYQRRLSAFATTPTEGVSQLYLTGRGDRSYFDARSIYYYGFSEADSQKQIPIIHPVVDYNYTFGQPILGGELSLRTNVTSLSRESSSFNPISATAFLSGNCGPTTAAPGARLPADCLLRGIPGTYSRFSIEGQWRRSFTDGFGQVFTPFALVRADAAAISIKNDPGVANFIETGDRTEFRAMPTVGVEYRYPLVNVQSWGTNTLEPIAQIIVRPNEQRIGRLPNEDAQSLVFDDSNLFRLDKFSGWDRTEGGGRANFGVQHTTQFNRGGFVSAMFGQSYQLFGTNSFAVGDITNTGLDSGLETRLSDYVARLTYQPDRTWAFTTRYRFDEQTLELRRFEAEARANFDRVSFSALYGSYDAQPLLGFLNRREGVLGTTQIKLAQHWVATAAVRYDLDAHKVDQTQFGIGYIDDCLILAMNYIASYTASGNTAPDQRVMLQLSLRTLGGAAVGQTIAGPGG